ncbi:hypothetical protein EPD60_06890 [Flaviaesturariibacter flavus]|uniref:Uncharacterized protein n=1 Tax=Flaviaesturariibacter flavus TaxID=2502780 RepID=A0A4R1BIC7_9BACT|nr:hypothetical protein [Flaviaesturariibacter flavus]TCJ17030.1 hypothetical protein EPD60_06890 [Flaviaesturariibacter flavus]
MKAAATRMTRVLPALLLLVVSTARAQTYSDGELRWRLDAGDARVLAQAYTRGQNGGEEVVFAVANMSDEKVTVSFQAYVTSVCGLTAERRIDYMLAPRQAESLQYLRVDGGDCGRIRTYPGNFTSMVSSVSVRLLAIAAGKPASGNKKLSAQPVVIKKPVVAKEPEVLSPAKPARAAGDCAQMVAYRDERLFEQWDKARSKYQLKAELVADIEKLRIELLEDSKNARSNWAQIRLHLKTVRDLVVDFVPSGTLARTAVQLGKVGKVAYRVDKFNNKVNDMIDVASQEDFEKAMVQNAKNELLELVPIVGGYIHFYENIQKIEDFEKLRDDVDFQLKQLATALETYKAALASAGSNFEVLNKYKDYIDNYLEKNCPQR